MKGNGPFCAFSAATDEEGEATVAIVVGATTVVPSDSTVVVVAG